MGKTATQAGVTGLIPMPDGVRVSAITHPAYMPKGEVRVDDPDGYCLLIGQVD